MFSRRLLSTTKTISESSALSVFQNSCYYKIDFKINEDISVREAVVRFAAFNIGCLAVTDYTNKVVGVCSERDYISKVACMNKNVDNIKVKDICTYGPKIIVAKKDDTLDTCLNKMMFKDIRHLLIMDDKNEECVGMLSIKDLVKEIIKDKTETISRLSDFNIGKGAFYGSE